MGGQQIWKELTFVKVRELAMSLVDLVLVCHAGFFQWVTVS